ncbi:MAG: TOBE domain-containing protein [Micromonosporaceae bacterium]
MNVLSGYAADGQVDPGGATPPTPAASLTFAGHLVTLGVRAKAIGPVDRSAPGALRATVDVFESMGSTCRSPANVAGQQLKLQTPATFRVEPGESLWLELPERHQRWFDPETALAFDT